MPSLNKVMIIGHLGDNPDIRYTKANKQVANLSVATSQKWKKNGETQQETVWHKVTAWGKLAEVCEKYINKGDAIYVEGSYKENQWENDNGEKRSRKYIDAFKIVMLGSKGNNGGNSGGGGSRQGGQSGSAGSQQAQPRPSKQVVYNDDFDDDLPF